MVRSTFEGTSVIVALKRVCSSLPIPWSRQQERASMFRVYAQAQLIGHSHNVDPNSLGVRMASDR